MPRKKSSSVKYGEGDCLAVPLPGGGFAVGLVARVAPGGAVAFGYFFGPRLHGSPEGLDINRLRPEDAVLLCRFGDLGIIEGSWRSLGRLLEWRRREWPMPAFHRLVPLDNRILRVVYRDENPNSMPKEERISEQEAANLPRDGLLGSEAVERVLGALLSESRPMHE